VFQVLKMLQMVIGSKDFLAANSSLTKGFKHFVPYFHKFGGLQTTFLNAVGISNKINEHQFLICL
jgi:hypothetical protein